MMENFTLEGKVEKRNTTQITVYLIMSIMTMNFLVI